MQSVPVPASTVPIRLARGFTGRALVVKFAGCYHGASDSLLAAGGSGIANQGLPGSDGVPASALQTSPEPVDFGVREAA